MPAMKLSDYLKERGITPAAFARSVGERLGRTVPRATIAAIAHTHTNCRSDFAHAIVEESKANPTADGAHVTLADLVRDTTPQCVRRRA